jgi:hypothetical protein
MSEYVVVYHCSETDEYEISVTDSNWDDIVVTSEQDAADEAEAIAAETGYKIIWS